MQNKSLKHGIVKLYVIFILVPEMENDDLVCYMWSCLNREYILSTYQYSVIDSL